MWTIITDPPRRPPLLTHTIFAGMTWYGMLVWGMKRFIPAYAGITARKKLPENSVTRKVHVREWDLSYYKNREIVLKIRRSCV